MSGHSESESPCPVDVAAMPSSVPARAEAAKKRLRVTGHLLLALGVLIPLLGMLPELVFLTPDLNDSSFHLGVTRNTIDAIREGANPLDFWVPTWLCGYPLFHYYQPGPYLLLALLHFILPHGITLLFLYRCVTILVLTLFPASNYVALRWLGLPRETAGWGAFLSCLIAGHSSWGIEMGTFMWSGWGLFAQAFALPVLPLALAGGWRAVRGSRRTLRYAAILAAAFMTHILYGYIAALSIALIPFLQGNLVDARARLRTLSRFSLQALALVAFFVVPLMRDVAFHAKSLYDPVEKFDSHGAVVILTRLFSGELFDYQRLPVFTCLVAAGLYLCLRRWNDDESGVQRWITASFVFWMLFYFGRPTWGALIDLVPMTGGLHLERLSSGVHIFAIWLAAIALGAFTRWWLSFESAWLRLALTLLIGTLVAGPMLGERVAYFVRNAQIVKNAKAAFERDEPDFAPILRQLRELPPGRVYAGQSGNWGRSYIVGGVQTYLLLSAEGIDQIANAPYSWSLSTDLQVQMQWPDRAEYNLWDITYLLTDQTPPPPVGAELLLQSGKHRLYRLASEGPFGIAAVPIAIAGDKESVWYMMNRWFHGEWSKRRTYARLLLNDEADDGAVTLRMTDRFHYLSSDGVTHHVFDTPDIFAQPAPAPASGSLREAKSSRQDASVTVELKQPGVVLFKSTYHPGWRASLDDEPVPTVALTPGMLGVAVPAGIHRLAVQYRAGWEKGVLLLLGLLLAVALERFPARPQT